MSQLTKTIPHQIETPTDYYNLLLANLAGEEQAIFDYGNTIKELEEAAFLDPETMKDAKAIIVEIRNDERKHRYLLNHLIQMTQGEQLIRTKAASELISIVGRDDPNEVK